MQPPVPHPALFAGAVLTTVDVCAVAADNRMEEDTRPLSAPANEPEPAAEQPAAPGTMLMRALCRCTDYLCGRGIAAFVIVHP